MVRGIALTADDRLRRDVITRPICHFRLDYAAIEAGYDTVFRDSFAAEIAALRSMQSDGLLTLDDHGIAVAAGKLLIRNICMAFDCYLQDVEGQRYSRVI